MIIKKDTCNGTILQNRRLNDNRLRRGLSNVVSSIILYLHTNCKAHLEETRMSLLYRENLTVATRRWGISRDTNLMKFWSDIKSE